MWNRVSGAVLAAALLLVPRSNRAGADEPSDAPPALTVQFSHPETQGDRLIGLFRGARAPHPAAALAAWKHATGGRAGLGKAREAVIAAMNPSMLGELRNLDGAVLSIGFAPETGRVQWRAVLPHDDGSFAAMATALALTDGAVEAPMGTEPVLRLGPPGSALASGRAWASTREGLRAAIDGPSPPRDRADPSRSGWQLGLDPRGLRGLASVPGRRLSSAIDAVGCRAVRGWLALDDETLSLEISTQVDPPPRPLAAIDPGWLNVVPASGVLAAVSFRLDTAAASLDAAFAWLDRVEKADPARAGVGPLRTRVNLLAAAARVRPEVELWPELRGLTVAVLVDDAGRVDGAVVVLQTADPAAAARIKTRVLPRLASAYLQGGDGSFLGRLGGKPLAAAVLGDGVIIGWGDRALKAGIDAWENPGRSAARSLRIGRGENAPQRVALVWVGRHRSVAAPGSPLAIALADAPPVVWEGRDRGGTAVDLLRWSGLRGVVRRWLAALPLEPPPS